MLDLDICGYYVEDLGMCALSFGHADSHGWDYATGEPRWQQLKDVRDRYIKAGLLDLWKRMAWTWGLNRDYVTATKGRP